MGRLQQAQPNTTQHNTTQHTHTHHSATQHYTRVLGLKPLPHMPPEAQTNVCSVAHARVALWHSHRILTGLCSCRAGTATGRRSNPYKDRRAGKLPTGRRILGQRQTSLSTRHCPLSRHPPPASTNARVRRPAKGATGKRTLVVGGCVARTRARRWTTGASRPPTATHSAPTPSLQAGGEWESYFWLWPRAAS